MSDTQSTGLSSTLHSANDSVVGRIVVVVVVVVVLYSECRVSNSIHCARAFTSVAYGSLDG